jgi:hypothetical protein
MGAVNLIHPPITSNVKTRQPVDLRQVGEVKTSKAFHSKLVKHSEAIKKANTPNKVTRTTDKDNLGTKIASSKSQETDIDIMSKVWARMFVDSIPGQSDKEEGSLIMPDHLEKDAMLETAIKTFKQVLGNKNDNSNNEKGA